MIDTQEQLPKPGGDKDPRENWSNLEWDYYYLRTNEGQEELKDMIIELQALAQKNTILPADSSTSQ